MKFKNLFNDWKLKLLSVVLAIVAWVVILGFVDPTLNRTIANRSQTKTSSPKPESPIRSTAGFTLQSG